MVGVFARAVWGQHRQAFTLPIDLLHLMARAHTHTALTHQTHVNTHTPLTHTRARARAHTHTYARAWTNTHTHFDTHTHTHTDPPHPYPQGLTILSLQQCQCAHWSECWWWSCAADARAQKTTPTAMQHCVAYVNSSRDGSSTDFDQSSTQCQVRTILQSAE